MAYPAAMDKTKLAIDPRLMVLVSRADFEAPFDPKSVVIGDDTSWDNAKWDSWGHTSQEEFPAVEKDGGDITTYNTAEEDSVESTKAPETHTLTITTNSLTQAAFERSFPGGKWDAALKAYIIPEINQREKSVMIIGVNGDKSRRFMYIPRYRFSGDSLPAFNREGLAAFTTKGTLLKHDNYGKVVIGEPRPYVKK